jgi:hypothetical protein
MWRRGRIEGEKGRTTVGERRVGKDDGQRGKASGSARLHGEKDVKYGDADAEQEKRLGRYG